MPHSQLSYFFLIGVLCAALLIWTTGALTGSNSDLCEVCPNSISGDEQCSGGGMVEGKKGIALEAKRPQKATRVDRYEDADELLDHPQKPEKHRRRELRAPSDRKGKPLIGGGGSVCDGGGGEARRKAKPMAVNDFCPGDPYTAGCVDLCYDVLPDENGVLNVLFDGCDMFAGLWLTDSCGSPQKYNITIVNSDIRAPDIYTLGVYTAIHFDGVSADVGSTFTIADSTLENMDPSDECLASGTQTVLFFDWSSDISNAEFTFSGNTVNGGWDYMTCVGGGGGKSRKGTTLAGGEVDGIVFTNDIYDATINILNNVASVDGNQYSSFVRFAGLNEINGLSLNVKDNDVVVRSIMFSTSGQYHDGMAYFLSIASSSVYLTNMEISDNYMDVRSGLGSHGVELYFDTEHNDLGITFSGNDVYVSGVQPSESFCSETYFVLASLNSTGTSIEAYENNFVAEGFQAIAFYFQFDVSITDFLAIHSNTYDITVENTGTFAWFVGNTMSEGLVNISLNDGTVLSDGVARGMYYDLSNVENTQYVVEENTFDLASTSGSGEAYVLECYNYGSYNNGEFLLTDNDLSIEAFTSFGVYLYADAGATYGKLALERNDVEMIGDETYLCDVEGGSTMTEWAFEVLDNTVNGCATSVAYMTYVNFPTFDTSVMIHSGNRILYARENSENLFIDVDITSLLLSQVTTSWNVVTVEGFKFDELTIGSTTPNSFGFFSIGSTTIQNSVCTTEYNHVKSFARSTPPVMLEFTGGTSSMTNVDFELNHNIFEYAGHTRGQSMIVVTTLTLSSFTATNNTFDIEAWSFDNGNVFHYGWTLMSFGQNNEIDTSIVDIIDNTIRVVGYKEETPAPMPLLRQLGNPHDCVSGASCNVDEHFGITFWYTYSSDITIAGNDMKFEMMQFMPYEWHKFAAIAFPDTNSLDDATVNISHNKINTTAVYRATAILFDTKLASGTGLFVDSNQIFVRTTCSADAFTYYSGYVSESVRAIGMQFLKCNRDAPMSITRNAFDISSSHMALGMWTSCFVLSSPIDFSENTGKIASRIPENGDPVGLFLATLGCMYGEGGVADVTYELMSISVSDNTFEISAAASCSDVFFWKFDVYGLDQTDSVFDNNIVHFLNFPSCAGCGGENITWDSATVYTSNTASITNYETTMNIEIDGDRYMCLPDGSTVLVTPKVDVPTHEQEVCELCPVSMNPISDTCPATAQIAAPITMKRKGKALSHLSTSAVRQKRAHSHVPRKQRQVKALAGCGGGGGEVMNRRGATLGTYSGEEEYSVLCIDLDTESEVLIENSILHDGLMFTSSSCDPYGQNDPVVYNITIVNSFIEVESTQDGYFYNDYAQFFSTTPYLDAIIVSCVTFAIGSTFTIRNSEVQNPDYNSYALDYSMAGLHFDDATTIEGMTITIEDNSFFVAYDPQPTMGPGPATAIFIESPMKNSVLTIENNTADVSGYELGHFIEVFNPGRIQTPLFEQVEFRVNQNEAIILADGEEGSAMFTRFGHYYCVVDNAIVEFSENSVELQSLPPENNFEQVSQVFVSIEAMTARFSELTYSKNSVTFSGFAHYAMGFGLGLEQLLDTDCTFDSNLIFSEFQIANYMGLDIPTPIETGGFGIVATTSVRSTLLAQNNTMNLKGAAYAEGIFWDGIMQDGLFELKDNTFALTGQVVYGVGAPTLNALSYFNATSNALLLEGQIFGIESEAELSVEGISVGPIADSGAEIALNNITYVAYTDGTLASCPTCYPGSHAGVVFGQLQEAWIVVVNNVIHMSVSEWLPGEAVNAISIAPTLALWKSNATIVSNDIEVNAVFQGNAIYFGRLGGESNLIVKQNNIAMSSTATPAQVASFGGIPFVNALKFSSCVRDSTVNINENAYELASGFVAMVVQTQCYFLNSTITFVDNVATVTSDLENNAPAGVFWANSDCAVLGSAWELSTYHVTQNVAVISAGCDVWFWKYQIRKMDKCVGTIANNSITATNANNCGNGATGISIETTQNTTDTVIIVEDNNMTINGTAGGGGFVLDTGVNGSASNVSISFKDNLLNVTGGGASGINIGTTMSNCTLDVESNDIVVQGTSPTGSSGVLNDTVSAIKVAGSDGNTQIIIVGNTLNVSGTSDEQIPGGGGITVGNATDTVIVVEENLGTIGTSQFPTHFLELQGELDGTNVSIQGNNATVTSTNSGAYFITIVGGTGELQGLSVAENSGTVTGTSDAAGFDAYNSTNNVLTTQTDFESNSLVVTCTGTGCSAVGIATWSDDVVQLIGNAIDVSAVGTANAVLIASDTMVNTTLDLNKISAKSTDADSCAICLHEVGASSSTLILSNTLSATGGSAFAAVEISSASLNSTNISFIQNSLTTNGIGILLSTNTTASFGVDLTLSNSVVVLTSDPTLIHGNFSMYDSSFTINGLAVTSTGEPDEAVIFIRGLVLEPNNPPTGNTFNDKEWNPLLSYVPTPTPPLTKTETIYNLTSFSVPHTKSASVPLTNSISRSLAATRSLTFTRTVPWSKQNITSVIISCNTPDFTPGESTSCTITVQLVLVGNAPAAALNISFVAPPGVTIFDATSATAELLQAIIAEVPYSTTNVTVQTLIVVDPFAQVANDTVSITIAGPGQQPKTNSSISTPSIPLVKVVDGTIATLIWQANGTIAIPIAPPPPAEPDARLETPAQFTAILECNQSTDAALTELSSAMQTPPDSLTTVYEEPCVDGKKEVRIQTDDPIAASSIPNLQPSALALAGITTPLVAAPPTTANPGWFDVVVGTNQTVDAFITALAAALNVSATSIEVVFDGTAAPGSNETGTQEVRFVTTDPAVATQIQNLAPTALANTGIVTMTIAPAVVAEPPWFDAVIAENSTLEKAIAKLAATLNVSTKAFKVIYNDTGVNGTQEVRFEIIDPVAVKKVQALKPLTLMNVGISTVGAAKPVVESPAWFDVTLSGNETIDSTLDKLAATMNVSRSEFRVVYDVPGPNGTKEARIVVLDNEVAVKIQSLKPSELSGSGIVTLDATKTIIAQPPYFEFILTDGQPLEASLDKLAASLNISRSSIEVISDGSGDTPVRIVIKDAEGATTIQQMNQKTLLTATGIAALQPAQGVAEPGWFDMTVDCNRSVDGTMSALSNMVKVPTTSMKPIHEGECVEGKKVIRFGTSDEKVSQELQLLKPGVLAAAGITSLAASTNTIIKQPGWFDAIVNCTEDVDAALSKLAVALKAAPEKFAATSTGACINGTKEVRFTIGDPEAAQKIQQVLPSVTAEVGFIRVDPAPEGAFPPISGTVEAGWIVKFSTGSQSQSRKSFVTMVGPFVASAEPQFGDYWAVRIHNAPKLNLTCPTTAQVIGNFLDDWANEFPNKEDRLVARTVLTNATQRASLIQCLADHCLSARPKKALGPSDFFALFEPGSPCIALLPLQPKQIPKSSVEAGGKQKLKVKFERKVRATKYTERLVKGLTVPGMKVKRDDINFTTTAVVLSTAISCPPNEEFCYMVVEFEATVRCSSTDNGIVPYTLELPDGELYVITVTITRPEVLITAWTVEESQSRRQQLSKKSYVVVNCIGAQLLNVYVEASFDEQTKISIGIQSNAMSCATMPDNSIKCNNGTVVCNSMSADATPWIVSFTSSMPTYFLQNASVVIRAWSSNGLRTVTQRHFVQVAPPQIFETTTTEEGATLPEAQMTETDGPVVPAAQQAVVRGIFSRQGDGQLHFLMYAYLAFILLSALQILYKYWRVASRTQILADTHNNVSFASKMLKSHVLIGFVLPCHYYCAHVHATILFCSLLIVFVVVCGLMGAVPGGMSDVATAIIVGVAASVVQVVVRPLLEMYFYVKSVAVSESTFAKMQKSFEPRTLTSVDMEISIPEQAAASRFVGIDQIYFGMPLDEPSAEGTQQKSINTTVQVDPATEVDDEILFGTLRVSGHYFFGYIVCAIVAIICTLLTYFTTIEYTQSQFNTFWYCTLSAFLFSVFVTELLYSGMRYLYRWIIADEGEEEAEELHPYEGEQRELCLEDIDAILARGTPEI